MSNKNTQVFLDVSIDGDPAERMVFELFSNAAPMTAENFRALCTGEKGSSPKTGRPLHYKGSFFHRIVKGLLAQGGDILNRDGTCGESIFGEKFPDEPISKLKLDERGMLTMAVADREMCGSLFSITFKPNKELDRKHVVFGKLVQGFEILEKIENVGDEDGRPLVTVKIVNCGEFFEEKKKREKFRGKDRSSQLHEVNREGKRKKSSRHKRKTRKYYSSESEFSLDSETESSDSDSDSESPSLSSSSDDKQKKRKRSSRRDRYKLRKKRNKRREKKRRRRVKRSKRRSKRASDSLTDTNSQSESSDDADAGGINKRHKTSSEMIASKQPSLSDRTVLPDKGTTDIYEKEVEYPSKNGDFQSNGTDIEAKAGKIAGGPDIVNDHPGKSRSRSLSPKRSLSKSISREKSLSPRQSIRGPIFDKSPNLTSQRSRSISRSPMRDVKRNLSRSPVKFSLISKRRSSVKAPSRRSISKSPTKAHTRSNFSRSPVSDRGRSLSRSPIRDVKRSLSRSPIRAQARRNYPRSPVSDRGRSLSKSPRDESPKRIRRGRGFSQRFSYARRYRTPSPEHSPVRSYRYGRNDRERYRGSPRYNRSSPRDRTPLRNSPRRYRSPPTERSPVRRSPRRYRSPPRERTPLRYRSRKSRTKSPLSQSPTHYRAKSRTLPSRSGSPVITRPSPGPPSPKRAISARSSSSSRSPVRNSNKGLVSYDDGSPDFNQN